MPGLEPGTFRLEDGYSYSNWATSAWISFEFEVSSSELEHRLGTLNFELWTRNCFFGQSGRIWTCEHLFPKQARLAICGTPWFRFWILDFGFGFRIEVFLALPEIQNRQSKIQNDLASGTGVEPVFSDSKPDVLPVRRPRKKVGGRRKAVSSKQ